MRNIEARAANPRVIAVSVRRRVGISLVVVAAAAAQTSRPKFYDDDPIGREPETQDASGAAEHDIGLFYSLSTTCSSLAGARGVRGGRAT